MKKSVISILLALIFVFTTVSTVFADEWIDDIPNDAHKVKNKWDAVGSFYTDGRGVPYELTGTWTYDIHIKQAMYGPYSKGVIVFTSGDDVITAHVEDVKEDYAYWASREALRDNIAAAGTAEFRGEEYYFIFIYSPGAMWIVLSENPYASAWDVETMISSRAYELLSPWPPIVSIYDLDPKEIH